MKNHLKTLFQTTVLAVALVGVSAAQAGPHWGGGYRGGYHHHHGGGGRWIAPAIIGGALLATAIAAPAYAYPVPVPAPVVVVPPVSYASPVYSAPVQQPMGYYCPTSGQFYPYVPTCSVPWQLM